VLPKREKNPVGGGEKEGGKIDRDLDVQVDGKKEESASYSPRGGELLAEANARKR